MPDATSQYVLGSTDAEHQRLIRQAARLNPITERLFLEAGIGPGQRILDIGSGVGDVALLAAKIVGPTGAVLCVERDPRTLAFAQSRVAEAGLHHVSFLQADIAHLEITDRFDAAVGRLILQFLPDPAAALHSISKLVRPAGVIAFQEPTWTPLLQFTAHLPLWSACVSLLRATFQRSGASTDMQLVLFRAFVQAGIPTPVMRTELPIGIDSFFAGWVADLLGSVRPQIDPPALAAASLGDFTTLQQRLQSELASANSPGACIALVSAWSRTPA